MRKHPRGRKPHDSRLRILRCEPLEDRRMLAVVTVDTPLDVIDFTDGVTSLREAIFATNLVGGHDEIVFDFGHDGPETILLTEGELQISDSLTITGPGAELLTIDASGSDPTPEEDNGDGSRVFNVDDGTSASTIVELAGLTITGADTSSMGGAIFSQEVLTISNSTITGNSAGQGGGIFSFNSTTINDGTVSGNTARSRGGGISAAGTTTIRGSMIEENTSKEGGGIWAKGLLMISDSTVSENQGDRGGGIFFAAGTNTISGTRISGNWAYDGGGIFAGSSTTSISNSTLTNNFAVIAGGGINARSGTLQISHSEISSNSAERGGGVLSGAGGSSIINSAITSNSAITGGGVHMNRGEMTISSSTLSGNSAKVSGGGAFLLRASGGSISHTTITNNTADEDNDGVGRGGGVYSFNSEANLDHTIVAGNHDNSGAAHDVAGVVNASYSLIGFGAQFLGPLADNGGPTMTHAFLPGSPAINAGDPDFVGPPDYDQRGFPFQRVSGSRIDIGALESQPLPGDFDLDLDVDYDDLTVWEAGYGNGMSGADFLAWQAMVPTFPAPPVPLPFETSASAESALTGNVVVLEAVPPVIVTTHLDTVDLSDGLISLREAIFATNLIPGEHTIEFDPSLAGQTILLTMGELVISDALTLQDLGADQLVVDAQYQSRIFHITDTAGDVTLAGLTLTRGSNLIGGAILSISPGTLTIEDSIVTDNHATGAAPFTGRNGGGIHAEGNVALVDSVMSDNTAYGSGGGVFSLGNVSLAGSTITGNVILSSQNFPDTPYPGGGGVFAGGNVTLLESHVSNNSSSRYGGGINASGDVMLIDSFVEGNYSTLGVGAIFAQGEVTLSQSMVNHNNSYFGTGGVYGGGGVSAWESTVDGNQMLGPVSDIAGRRLFLPGGGIMAFEHINLRDSTVSGNTTTSFGGGIFLGSGQATVVNSTISGNYAGQNGGGIAMFYADLVLEHSTVTANHADRFGGGIWNWPTFGPPTGTSGNPTDMLALSHSIVAGNSAGSALPDLGFTGQLSLDHSLISDSSGMPLAEAPVGLPDANGNLIGGLVHGVIDPLLGSLADNGGPTLTHALLSGSPAINRGDLNAAVGVNGVPQFDQRGAPFDRIFGGRIDIGAFEYQAASDLNLLVDTLDDESDGDYGRGDLSLREAIELANMWAGHDTIQFDSTLAGGTIFLDLRVLEVYGALTIQGLGAELLTVDGQEQSPLFYIGSSAANVAISGLTLTHGTGLAGAIFSEATLTLQDMSVVENYGGTVGGVIATNDLVVERSRFERNFATVAGAVMIVARDRTAVISASTFSGNIGQTGSEIVARLDIGSSLRISNSSLLTDGVFVDARNQSNFVLQSSTVSGAATGIRIQMYGHSSAMIESSTITNNGTGISSRDPDFSSSLLVRSTTVSGNTNGGIAISGEATISHSTITNNTGGRVNPNGPIVAGGVSLSSGTLLLDQSIVAGNFPRGSGPTDIAGVVNVSYSLIGFGAQFLGPLADNGGPTLTHALLPGSPAINAGVPNFVGPPDYDQRGFPFQRVSGGRIDIGAYESQPTPGDFDQNLVVNHDDLTYWETGYGNGMSGLDFLAWQAMMSSIPAPPPPVPLAGETTAQSVPAAEVASLEAGSSVVVTTPLDVVDFNDGVTSLREAIFATNLVAGHDEIVFDFGHDGPETILLTQGELHISDSLTITGSGAALLTIDASGNDPTPDEDNGDGSGVFVVDDADTDALIDVAISGLTLTGADVDRFDGGVVSSQENLTLTSAVFSGNAAPAVNNRYGDVNILSSIITGNASSGDPAGAVYVYGGDLNLMDSTVSHNVTRFGGSYGLVAVFSGDTRIVRSTVSDNFNEGSARPAVYVAGGLTIEDSEISRNQNAVGVSNDTVAFPVGPERLIEISNSTVSDNGRGGLRFGASSTTDIIIHESTISDNGGTGITIGRRMAIRLFSPRSTTISNSLIHGNRSTGVGGVAIYGGTVSIADTEVSHNTENSIALGGSTIMTGGGGIHIGTESEVNITRAKVFGNTKLGYSDRSEGGGIFLENATATVSDSSIYDNSSDGSGGGIALSGGSTTILRTTVVGNETYYVGGGVSGGGNALSIVDSDVSNNIATEGGGIWSSHQTIEIVRSSIDSNTALGEHFYSGRGGGIFSSGTLSPSIVDSSVAGNAAVAEGGGVYAFNGANIASSTIANNSAENGGGVWTVGGLVENSTVTGNSAEIGGGIYVAPRAGTNPPPTTTAVRHNTIAFNEASVLGGGIFVDAANLELDHTIIARNTGARPDLTGLLGSTITAHYSLIGNNSGSGFAQAPVGSPDVNGNLVGGTTTTTRIDPLLGPLAGNGGPTLTHALLLGSPALNAGDPNFVGPPDYDQRGFPFQRVSGGRIDIGAYESQPLPGDFDDDLDVDGDDLSWWEAGYGAEYSGLDFLAWQVMLPTAPAPSALHSFVASGGAPIAVRIEPRLVDLALTVAANEDESDSPTRFQAREVDEQLQEVFPQAVSNRLPQHATPPAEIGWLELDRSEGVPHEEAEASLEIAFDEVFAVL